MPPTWTDTSSYNVFVTCTSVSLLKRLGGFVKRTYKKCILRGLRPCVSLIYTPDNSLSKPNWKNVKLHHRDSNQGHSAYWADALTTAVWCSSYPQRRKHEISPTCLHLLATHTTQLYLRPQTIKVNFQRCK